MQVNYKWKYLGIITAVVGGYLFLFYFKDLSNNYTFCIFKFITGIPCPACGSTRATLKLINGDLQESILINPLAILTNLLILISAIWMTKDIIKGKETFLPSLKRDWNRKSKIIIFLIICLNWIRNIAMGIGI